MKRREFLQIVSAAAVTSSLAELDLTAAQTARPAAAALKVLNPHESQTLVKMSRQIFPHDRLNDSYYQKVVEALDTEASTIPETVKLLREGIVALDGPGGKFIELSPDAQVAALKKIESTSFFQKVRGSEMTALYNNPDVCKQFGYQGPSYARGGYTGRQLPAFDDLKWLPDPPEAASPKPARRIVWLSSDSPTTL